MWCQCAAHPSRPCVTYLLDWLHWAIWPDSPFLCCACVYTFGVSYSVAWSLNHILMIVVCIQLLRVLYVYSLRSINVKHSSSYCYAESEDPLPVHVRKQEQHYLHCSKSWCPSLLACWSYVILTWTPLGIAEWPLFSLPYLAEPNHMSHLQGLVTVLLQLVGGSSSGVAVFQTSQLVVAERN